MKKISLMLLTFAMCFSLTACGSSENAKPSTTDASIAGVGQTVTQAIKTPENKDKEEASTETFELCNDLTVVSSFTYDNDQYVVVENVGDQAILEFSVAYINFDKNGFPMESGDYERGRYESANMMPGDKRIGSWYGSDGAYSEAIVCGVKYQNGTEWELENIDAWQAETLKTFSVAEYKEKITALSENASKAYDIGDVAISNIKIVKDNPYSTSKDYNFSLENKSNQGILSVSIYVLEFDENGFPVSVSPYDKYCKNGHALGGTVNLGAGKKGSFGDDLFISGDTKYTKEIITQIEYQDGTVWENPYMYEWIISNNASYVEEKSGDSVLR